MDDIDDIFVGRLMSSTVHTVSSDTLVETAAELLLEEAIGSVVVVDEAGRLDGILTTTDFVAIVAGSHPKAESSVTEYMTTDVITTTAQASMQDAADAMIEHGIHHLPVVDDTEGVIGMLSTTDLSAYLSRVRNPTPS
jgi:CBS domain-containing protein